MFDPTSLLRGPAGWLLVVLAANLSVVLAAAALLVLASGTGTEARSGRDAGGGRDAGDDRIRCPNCRTANVADYRFCRECLDELPGGGRVGAGGSDPRRRPMP